MRKGKTLSVYVPDHIYDAIRTESEELGLSVSSYITMVISLRIKNAIKDWQHKEVKQ